MLVGFDHTQCASVRANSWSAKQMRRRSAKRSLDFVAMEHRVTMSAGLPYLGATLPAHAVISAQTEHAKGTPSEEPRVRLAVSAGTAHPDGTFAAEKVSVIKGSFAGGNSELVDGGPLIYMTGSSGKVGKESFGATVEGEVSGNTFVGGSLLLSNSQGTIIASLGPATPRKVGKAEDLKVVFVFDDATGKYIPTEGSAGTATIKLGTSKSGAKSVAQAEPIWDFDNAWDELGLVLNSFYLAAVYPVLY